MTVQAYTRSWKADQFLLGRARLAADRRLVGLYHLLLGHLEIFSTLRCAAREGNGEEGYMDIKVAQVVTVWWEGLGFM